MFSKFRIYINCILTIGLLIINYIPLKAQLNKDSTLIKKVSSLEMNSVSQREFTDKLGIIDKKIENEANLSEKRFNTISNQIDAATFNLTIFGILFTIAAIGLGWYVTYIERKVIKLSEDTKKIFSKNQKIKKEIEELNDFIQKDIRGLYLKIKNEETTYIINRLIEVPEDIHNLQDTLFSRDINESEYPNLRTAYNKLESPFLSLKDKYLAVFLQHFSYNIMKDDNLRKDFLDFCASNLIGLFKNDLLKIVRDFTRAVIELGISTHKDEINKFLKVVSQSTFIDSNDVYLTIFDTLVTRNNQFTFFNLVISSDNLRIVKRNYGKLLMEKCVEPLNKNEELVFDEANKLINE